jgi:hypothetical protein
MSLVARRIAQLNESHPMDVDIVACVLCEWRMSKVGGNNKKRERERGKKQCLPVIIPRLLPMVP